MNKINISDTAKSIAKAHVEPKSRSAWVLDADVQAAVDTLFIEMKGQVPKRRLINALLRSALSGEPYVTLRLRRAGVDVHVLRSALSGEPYVTESAKSQA